MDFNNFHRPRITSYSYALSLSINTSSLLQADRSDINHFIPLLTLVNTYRIRSLK